MKKKRTGKEEEKEEQAKESKWTEEMEEVKGGGVKITFEEENWDITILRPCVIFINFFLNF